jgi:hypothetical protein
MNKSGACRPGPENDPPAAPRDQTRSAAEGFQELAVYFTVQP